MDKNDPLYVELLSQRIEMLIDVIRPFDMEPRDTISIHQIEQLMEEYRKLLEKYNKLQAYCNTLQKSFSELILCHERLIELAK